MRYRTRDAGRGVQGYAPDDQRGLHEDANERVPRDQVNQLDPSVRDSELERDHRGQGPHGKVARELD